MDFGKLLHTAQKNDHTNKNGVRYYSTKFEPPKKEKRANHELSANIKKFLARKEAEEKRKIEEEKRKREELLALRSQDKKATRRVNVMLKRTKSANQSVIDDAIDKDNTAVTLAGPLQPDEDDYGYVSQEATALYSKMMEKYSKMPDEPKFDMTRKKVSTNLSGTKDRVRAALEREKEEAMMPHKRKRKHDKKDEGDEEGVSYEAPERFSSEKGSKDERSVKHKPRPPPPVMNFAELLKIAEKKQHEPIIIEKKEKEDETLMTKRQKREFEREKESKMRREEKWKGGPQSNEKAANSTKIPKISDKNGVKLERSVKSDSENKNKISQINEVKPVPKDTKIPNKSATNGSKLKASQENVMPRKYLPGDIRAKNGEEKRYLPGDIRAKQGANMNEKHHNKCLPENSKAKTSLNENYSQRKPIHGDAKQQQKPVLNNLPSKKNSNEDGVKTYERKYLPGDVRAKNGLSENSDLQKKQSLNIAKSKQNGVPSGRIPIKDSKPKQFPPPDVQRRGDRERMIKKPMIGKKRQILDDDDDEYDSEMDDFIDDGDVEDDYSKYISEIFGYDKNKYKDIEDDVDNMESSFAQQMREEVISTKIGIMEDLEDMKKEEEAKRRKKLMMKKRKL